MTCFQLPPASNQTSRAFQFPDGLSRLISLPQWCWDEYQFLIDDLDLDAVAAGYDAAVNIWGGKSRDDFETILRQCIFDAISTISHMAHHGIEANDVD